MATSSRFKGRAPPDYSIRPAVSEATFAHLLSGRLSASVRPSLKERFYGLLLFVIDRNNYSTNAARFQFFSPNRDFLTAARQ